jgi:hypothetical protein
LHRRAEHHAADAAESVDTYFDGHDCSLLSSFNEGGTLAAQRHSPKLSATAAPSTRCRPRFWA